MNHSIARIEAPLGHTHPGKVLQRSNTVYTVVGKIGASLEKIYTRVTVGVGRFVPEKSDVIHQTLLDQIRARFQNPKYLDSNNAIRDMNTLMFVVYKKKLFPKMPESEIIHTQKDLLKLVLYLR